MGRPHNQTGGTRSLRTSDFYFDALDDRIRALKAELAHLTDLRAHGGVDADADGTVLALDVTSEPLKDAHYASYPRGLVRPWIAACCPARCCAACGAGYVRETEKVDTGLRQKTGSNWDTDPGGHGSFHRNGRETKPANQAVLRTETLAWRPACSCADPRPPVPGTVLDIFAGSGTTAIEAEAQGRDAVLIELNPDYVTIAERRIETARAKRLHPAAKDAVGQARRQLALLEESGDDAAG